MTPWGGQEHQEQHAVDFNLEGTYKLFNREHEATLGYNYVRSRQHDNQSTGTINDTNVINSTTTNWGSWTPQSITWSDFTEAANYTQNKIQSMQLHVYISMKI